MKKLFLTTIIGLAASSAPSLKAQYVSGTVDNDGYFQGYYQAPYDYAAEDARIRAEGERHYNDTMAYYQRQDAIKQQHEDLMAIQENQRRMENQLIAARQEAQWHAMSPKQKRAYQAYLQSVFGLNTRHSSTKAHAKKH